MELIKTSLRCISLYDSVKKLIRYFSACFKLVDLNSIDKLVAKFLENALVEHCTRPRFRLAIVKDCHSVRGESKLDDPSLIFFKDCKSKIDELVILQSTQ